MINLQAFLKRRAHQQMRALDELAGGSPVELPELANEVRLVEIGRRGDVAPVGELLPGQAIGRVQSPEFAMKPLGCTAKIDLAQPFNLAR